MASKKKLRKQLRQERDRFEGLYVRFQHGGKEAWEAHGATKEKLGWVLQKLDTTRNELFQLRAAAGRLVVELDDCDFTETPEISIRADVVRELLDMDEPDSENGVTEGDYPNVVDTPAQQFWKAAQSEAGRAVGEALAEAMATPIDEEALNGRVRYHGPDFETVELFGRTFITGLKQHGCRCGGDCAPSVDRRDEAA
ncbi:hypothetical protein [Nocardia brasiliensis]|uniref:hypothetical protein n=1 Tax=Nocardia brasiliensis TaxID=37326 RepID=UPI002454D9CD|nr:hypothetical protein [Nocardia brasiliensis]